MKNLKKSGFISCCFEQHIKKIKLRDLKFNVLGKKAETKEEAAILQGENLYVTNNKIIEYIKVIEQKISKKLKIKLSI